MLTRLTGIGPALGLLSTTARAMLSQTIYDYSAKDVDGKDVSLSKYKGYAVLIVNVASECGLTKSNYTQLKEILEKYRDSGLRIAAFPCNQFGGQEPGCELDIKEFITKKYEFEPDLYSKVEVNGDNAHPLYKFLKEEQGGTITDAIKWNFTKFLVDRNGHVVKRYSPQTQPKDIVKDIETILNGAKV
uniref:Glutathione peroxidase n=2 Tax=Parascaris univalens TaxID=6257 RepID=A0A915ALV6_PARUN